MIKLDPIRKGRKLYWVCKCDCGNTKSIRSDALLSGVTKSCGCYNLECISIRATKHGLSKHPLFKEWTGIKQRCYNPNERYYYNYGGRGITVCDEWLNNPEAFVNWCLSNGYKKGLTLDRIDNNKGYSPNNCRWTTKKVQANNTRRNRVITYNNKTHTVAEWADIMNINYDILIHRLARGIDFEKAITTPVKTRGGK